MVHLSILDKLSPPSKTLNLAKQMQIVTFPNLQYS